MKNYKKGNYKYYFISGPGKVWSNNDNNNYIDDYEFVEVSILKDSIEDSFEDMNDRGLAEYIHTVDLENIVSIEHPIPCDKQGRRLSNSENEIYLLWTVHTSSILTSTEQNTLKNYIEGQCSDGWGEGFEQQEIDTYSVEEDDEGSSYYQYTVNYYIHYSPWTIKNWTFKLLSHKVDEDSKKKRKFKKDIYIVENEVRVNENVILEKGDRIQIIKETRDIEFKVGDRIKSDWLHHPGVIVDIDFNDEFPYKVLTDAMDKSEKPLGFKYKSVLTLILSFDRIEDILREYETDDYQNRRGNYPKSGKPDSINFYRTNRDMGLEIEFKSTSERKARAWVERNIGQDLNNEINYTIESYQSSGSDYTDDWVTVNLSVKKF